MSEKEIAGKAEEVMGKAEAELGKLAGSEQFREKGTSEETKGKAKQAAAHIEEGVGEAAEKVKGQARKLTD